MAKPLLCATVVANGHDLAVAIANAVAPNADLVEIRLDALADPDPARLVRECRAPLVLTCRPPRQGGAYAGPEEERIDLLRRSVAAGPAFVDVEEDAAERLGDRGRTRVVVSWHDFEGTPADLPGILARIERHRPDIAKIVPTARTEEDVFRLLRLLREARRPLAAHPMGRPGFPGRILAARFGSAIVYGAAASAAAPGQPSLRSLREDFRLDRDLSRARPVLLLGGSLAHSVSPRMLNRCFAAEGVDALSVPFETTRPNVVLAALGGIDAAGAAVTIPLKEAVAREVDDLEPAAARIGAVNTVVVRDGRRTGANTDAPGAVEAIREALPDLAGRRAVVVGAGGAARAIAFGLTEAGARVVVVSRTRARAEALAAAVGGAAADWDEIDGDDVDLVANATPVGQAPDLAASPVPDGFLRPRMVVFDAVYNPRETRLLAAARALGCRVVGGMEMLARQAAHQVERWFGRSIDPARLAAEGAAALDDRRRPVLLVGMRGAGKSTAGPIVARRLGRPFVDLDQEIEREAGCSVPDIFRREGEPAFRDRELAALRRALSARPGAVVAAGGGALDRVEGRAAVAVAGARVVFLDAPADVLAARLRGSDRPALTSLPFREEVKALLREREPRYRSAAEVAVDAGTGDPAAVAGRILDALSGEG